MDARTCVKAIRAAGGKVSLAHPYQLNMDDTRLEKLAGELADYGQDAIECDYPRYIAEQTAFYLQLRTLFPPGLRLQHLLLQQHRSRRDEAHLWKSGRTPQGGAG